MDKTRMQQYMSQMRAMFNKHALYSDESPQYQIPFEPNPGDTVKIRFRTLKNNVDAVYFISGSTRAQMQVGLVRNGFDYYEIEIPVGNEPIRYFFEIQAGRVVCYYNKLGVTRELQEMYSFGIIPGFHALISRLPRDSTRRNGQRARSCTRFLWTASATEIRPTMC